MKALAVDLQRVTPPTGWDDPGRYLSLMGSAWGRTLIRLQSTINLSTAQFWAERDVHAVYLPVTTGAVSSPMGLGSDSTPVPVELFGAKTYLADSMQFLLEYACRMSATGAYYVMPSFRGEAADSSHLCQFFHSEAEIPGGLDDVIDTVEAYLRRLGTDLLDRCADDIAGVAGGTTHLERMPATGSFRRITFAEAVDLLGGRPEFVSGFGQGDRSWRTLTRAGERELMRQCGEFLWVTHYDHLSVPFYQAFGPQPGTAVNADLLFGMGEVVGAGERHTDAGTLRSALDLHQVDAGEYEWYIAMRERMPLRTAGFGLGIERFMMWLLQHWEIRDLQLLHRANGEVHNP